MEKLVKIMWQQYVCILLRPFCASCAEPLVFLVWSWSQCVRAPHWPNFKASTAAAASSAQLSCCSLQLWILQCRRNWRAKEIDIGRSIGSYEMMENCKTLFFILLSLPKIKIQCLFKRKRSEMFPQFFFLYTWGLYETKKCETFQPFFF